MDQGRRDWRELAEALPQIVWTAGPDGRVDFISQDFYRYTGVDPSRAGARNWLPAIHPEDRDAIRQVWQHAVASAQEFQYEVRIANAATGEYRWHLASGKPVSDGGSIRWYGAALDIHDRKLAEEALQSREERLRAIVESEPECVKIVSPEGVLVDMNPAGLRMIEADVPEQALGQPIGRLIHPEDRDAFRNLHRRAMAGADGQLAFRLIGLKGSERWMETHSSPLKGPDGTVQGVLSITRDVTERRHQNLRLLASEQRYRSIYDLVPVSIWEEDWSAVIARLRQMRNAGIRDPEQYLRENPDEVERALGKVRILDFNEVTLRMLEADSRDQVLEAMAAIVTTPGARSALRAKLLALARGQSGFETALTLRTVKGRTVEALLTTAFPPPDSDSGLVLVSVMDITSRRQAEERFRIVAQATNDVIWDWNLETDAIWWSDGLERQFGYRPGDLPADSRSWSDHLHPEDAARVTTGIEGAVAKGESSWTDEYRFGRADGSWAVVRDRGFVIRDADGRAVRMVGSMVDITEQRTLETQLRQAQRLDAIGQLTGGVAHDFNNLLTVILGSAELLLDGLAHDPRLRALADMTRSAAIRGSELTNRLLAFARRQPLDPKPVNVNRLVGDMDSLLRRTLGEQVELEIVQRGGLWSALADASQLENALLNLCINARDAMPAGGRLTIETANAALDDAYVADLPDVTPGQYVLVAVSDTGTGMDRDTLGRAFEPFFTTKEVGKGSGLGLSMVYGFAKQSRGHVRIYSEPGQGTTVKLYLPRADEVAREEVARRPAGQPPGGSERILLVEDDDLVRSYVERQLKGMGYSVVSARNGPEALEQLRGQAAFDLLFTDVIMPGGLSGRELAEQARALYPTLPVLFTSGYTENAIVHHGRLDRGVHLLQKPYRRDELAAKVRKVLDESRREFPDL